MGGEKSDSRDCDWPKPRHLCRALKSRPPVSRLGGLSSCCFQIENVWEGRRLLEGAESDAQADSQDWHQDLYSGFDHDDYSLKNCVQVDAISHRNSKGNKRYAHRNVLRIGQNRLALDTEKSTRLESWPDH